MAAYSENYVILPPTTTGDTAQPSNSVLRDVRRVLALLQDERILAANELYQNVTCRLNEWNEAHHEQQEQEKSPSKRHALKHAFGRLGHSKKTVDTTTSSQEITEDQEYRAANDLLQSRRIDIDKMIVRVRNVCLYAFLCVVFSLLFLVIATRRGYRKSKNETGPRRGMDTVPKALWCHNLLSAGRR